MRRRLSTRIEPDVSGTALAHRVPFQTPTEKQLLVRFAELGLPVCSALHAKMLGRPLGEGLSVWLVEKSIKLGLISIGAGLFALLILANKANG